MTYKGMGVLRASGTRLAPTGAVAETVIPIKFAEIPASAKSGKGGLQANLALQLCHMFSFPLTPEKSDVRKAVQ